MVPRVELLKKVNKVQKELRSFDINLTSETSFDEVVPVVFNACQKHDLTFYYNILEDSAVLNIVDLTSKEYNELHVRININWVKDANLDLVKVVLLRNAFLLTQNLTTDKFGEPKSEDIQIISSDKPMPKHITKAIDTIKAKGIPVTVEAIQNHLPLGQMSTSARIECNKYLKEMEAS